jgi:hypothetical protein
MSARSSSERDQLHVGFECSFEPFDEVVGAGVTDEIHELVDGVGTRRPASIIRASLRVRGRGWGAAPPVLIPLAEQFS